MVTILSRKHIRYDDQGRDVARVSISVANTAELPTKYDISNMVIAEGSRAWDISTGTRYGFVDNQGWKKQATVINPMVVKGRVDDVTDLPSTAEPGWVYLVGPSSSDNLDEYMYTESGVWDPIGSTSVTIEIDDALSTTSENPVQNKVVTSAINDKASTSSVTALSAILTPMSETEYESLVTKDRPLYFIYDDSV